MVLGFKTHIDGKPTGFAEKINADTKIHTLREDKECRWSKGVSIEFANVVGTDEYSEFKSGICTGTQEVFMSLDNCSRLEISIDDKYMYYSDIEELAQNDGFDSIEEFKEWFVPLVHKAEKSGLHGLMLTLVHWTDFRY